MTDSIDKKPKDKWDSLDADLDAMLDEAESSLAPLNDFRDDEEDAINRLLRDTGFDADIALEDIDEIRDEFGSDINLSDEVDGLKESETAQIAEDSAMLVGVNEAIVEEAPAVSLNELQNDEDTIDRLLMDTGLEDDDVGLVGEVNDGDLVEPEITQLVEADEPEQIAESVREQADEKPYALIVDETDETDEAAVAETDTFDEFDDFSDFSDFNEPETTQVVETDESADDSVALVEEAQSIEDELEQAIKQADALIVDDEPLVDEAEDDFAESYLKQQNEIEKAVSAADDLEPLVELSKPAEKDIFPPVNDLQNEEDAIDRLLQDTGFDSDDVDLVVYDSHAVLLRDTDFDADDALKDEVDFGESNIIREGDDGKTVQAIADSVDFKDDRQAGLFVDAAEKRGDLVDDDKDLDEIDEFAQLDEVGDIFTEQNIDDPFDEPEKQIQQADSEEIAVQADQNAQDAKEEETLLPDFDITADAESPDTWIDAEDEDDKLSEPDLFADDDAELEDELEKIGRAADINVTRAEVKPKPKQSPDNNPVVTEEAKDTATVPSQANAEPEFLVDEQYKKQIIDAEKRAKKATIFSYVALGFGIVTFVAATTLAVVAYSAKTEITKLIELVSALEQGKGDGAIKSSNTEGNKAPEDTEKQGIVGKALEILRNKISGSENKESAEPPVVEAAKAEAAKPEIEDAAKAEAAPETEIVQPEAEAAKVESAPETEAEKSKTEAAKAKVVSETETANPEADTVKSAAMLEAAVAKAVAPKAAAAKKIAKKKPEKVIKEKKAAVVAANWTVNLTAYKQEWYAKSKAAEFKQKGVPVEVVPGNINNTAWYRLRVRGFKNKGEAASYAARIKKALNLSAVTVSDN